VGAGTDVLINRQAKRLVAQEGGLRRLIAETAMQSGARVHETRTLEELQEVAQGIAARGTGGVVLAGGDGSYMAGLSALARAHGNRALPPIAFAPGGTVCTVARNLDMTGGARSYARRIVRAVCRGTAHTEPRPTLRVRDDRGGDHVGFIFGAGLVVRFFDAYYAAPRQGIATAARIVARIFAGSLTGSAYAERVLGPTRASLRIDGQSHAAKEWSLVLASTLRDVGLHLRVPYRAGEELERFHVVASGLSPRALGAQLPRALAGRPLSGEPRVDALVRDLRLAFGSEGGYVLDGDVFPARAVTVEAGPVLSLLRMR
jgi:diacylglycerol kinase (ATP)